MGSPQIVQLNMDHLDQVYDYVCTEWFDDEPVFSSIGLHRGSGFLHKQTMEGLKKDYFTKLLKPETGLSFGVFDDQGNVLGIKLGKIMTKETIDK